MREVLAVVISVHVIVVAGLGLGLWKVLPLVIKYPLELDTRRIHGRTGGGVEVRTIAGHELEVAEKRMGVGILVYAQLLPYCRLIHGLLNVLR